MNRKIEEYLAEVSHYISDTKAADDIIKEVRSHIIDRAQEEFGDTGDESLEKILSKLEEPRQMAEKYSQGQDIIAPYYRKHVIVYTAFLFFINLGVSVASIVLGKGIHMVPFMQVASGDFLTFLGGLPVTFFFYFGIVCMFFMIITKYKTVKPAWLGSALEGAGKDFGKPTMLGLAGRMIAFTVLAVLFMFQDELVRVITEAVPEIMVFALPDILVNAFIALAGIDLIIYVLRYLANTPVLEAMGAAFKLIVMAYIVRMPFGFENLSGLQRGVATGIEIGIRSAIVIIVVLTTIELIRWLMYSFSKKYLN